MRYTDDPTLYGRIPDPPNIMSVAETANSTPVRRKIPFLVEMRTGSITEIIQTIRTTAKNGRARNDHNRISGKIRREANRSKV